MSTWVVVVTTTLLGAAAALAVLRMALGPTTLNRTIAMDVLVAILVGGLGLEAAVNRHATTLPILVALSLLGFIGSVSVARFAAREDKTEGRPR